MPNPDLAKLFSENLAALPHPSGNPVRLTQFDTTTLPPGLREQVAEEHTKTTTSIGEALVQLLEDNGYPTNITTQQLDELTVKAKAFDGIKPPIASLYCTTCGTKLLDLNITRPERINTRPTTLRSVQCQCP
ncbi:hypothetical protein SAMN04488581_2618 [Mycolicibacterium neoaurum]|uniref:hypothetical protein n=1 Tax=Mycolicibacterium neoaurum TaxID=1795 RepID=UPI00088171EF|nr:hypothetical protein [Mycolicibacterium neoaurum]SDD59352.1 hypothetical protein SAMN04488581_2618 [Mycolicibacterium neoaurum]